MNKFKILVVLILCFAFYKGFVVIKDFEIGVDSRVAKIEEAAGFEKQDEVIGLMMYLGNPLELKEHLLVSSEKKCFELKIKAEENSNAYYECERVEAIISGGKIIEIIEELEVL